MARLVYLLMLVLSIFRMLVSVEIPGSVIILSDTFYPAIVRLARYEIISRQVFGLPMNVMNVFIYIWIIGAMYLIFKRLDKFFSFKYFPKLVENFARDEYAEKLLADIIGDDKHFRVFRNHWLKTVSVTAFKPYIILPEIDFTDDELKVILLHEWKHIQDKDYLTGKIFEVICLVFWWNPFVYILRRNFHFAQELKCDQFAVSNSDELIHYLKGIQRVDDLQHEQKDYFLNNNEGNTLVSANDEIVDRLNILILRSSSRSKRILTNACFATVILALFVASYMFIVLPIFWEVPDTSITADTFMEEYRDTGDIFMPGEAFVIDNGDGIFSLFLDGQFVRYVDGTFELLDFIPVRERE